MTEREALLAAVLDDPADEAARLVYADWLEEYGGGDDATRARLIRLTAEPRRVSVCENGVLQSAAFMREPALNRLVIALAREVLGDRTCHLTLRRGFFEEIECHRLRDWIAGGEAAVARHPLARVALRDRKPPSAGAVNRHAVVWFRHEDAIGDVYGNGMADVLPQALYDRLTGHTDEMPRIPAYKVFESTEAAEGALSRACLAWARSQPAGEV